MDLLSHNDNYFFFYLFFFCCCYSQLGKSTIMGHLLYLVGQVDQKQMHKYKGFFYFSFLWFCIVFVFVFNECVSVHILSDYKWKDRSKKI
jgi:hypothetical protein